MFQNTRRKILPLTQQALGANLMLTWDLPKTGLLAGIYLRIKCVLEGSAGVVNAYGMASAIRQVRLYLNSGIDVFRMSGVGYHYILHDFLEHYIDVIPQAGGTAAVSVATHNLDMFIPVALNARDPVGLIMLQNEQTLCTLTVEFEAPATVGGDITYGVTTTVEPTLELFTVPLDEADYPPLNMIHQILEEMQTLTAATGDHDYVWPRGNTYVQVLHGYGIKQSPADDWDRARLMVNQSETLIDYDPGRATHEFNRFHGRARTLGVIPIDLFGSSGLGCYGSARDFFDSALVTDVLTRITLNAADDLWTIRRQLVDLGEGG